ncbi:YcjF family protein [Azospirillum isscasi]|uniref:DUF697 domain-containing protein n=1 Tax=Azospirillum isscasi TaxID=3053926 RepID=A0ABU0WNU2_9PROT|nr:DUF697 domain-containing protein [Azospirillum isscasi]MDQ2105880.1 DUF697 domain-containing protein [Azospirillum isscasi]
MSDQLENAQAITRTAAKWAAGAGLIPVPLLDVAGVAGVQLKLVNDLSKLYGVPFAKDRAKALVATLLGGAVPSALTSGVFSLVKAVPIVGPLTGIALMPALSAAATLALGKVFIQHFETGGTLLDFDPEKTRAYFLDELEKAKAAGSATPEAPPKDTTATAA